MTALPPPRPSLGQMIVASALAGWLIGLVLCVNIVSYRRAHPSPKTMLRR